MCLFHHWRLEFRQFSFRHIARALQDGAFSVFQRLQLFRHALFPSGFRLQVNRMAQKYFLRTSSDCVRDSAARSAAHGFPSNQLKPFQRPFQGAVSLPLTFGYGLLDGIQGVARPDYLRRLFRREISK